MSIQDIEQMLEKNFSEVKTWVEKGNEEVAIAKATSVETKQALEKLVQEGQTLQARIRAVEQKQDIGTAPSPSQEFKTLGGEFIAKAQKGANGRFMGRVETDLMIKTAITNVYPATMTQPLVAGYRETEIIKSPDRVLRMRDLIPSVAISSNYVFFPKENVFTNNAAVTTNGSPQTAVENVTKPESAITFTSGEATVKTIAHTIPASLQVLEDAPQLLDYINSRMVYGLDYKIDSQLLNGTGAAETINGLLNQATAVATSVTGVDNAIDVIRRLILSAQQNEYGANACILNPVDWAAIELAKDSQGRYLVGDPNSLRGPNIWGLPVIVTNNMPSGSVLVGDFTNNCKIYDRKETSVDISYENGTNFEKNMATIRVEARLAFVVFRPAAFRKTQF